jgi:DNA-binding CsgD family transcriptional regulator
MYASSGLLALAAHMDGALLLAEGRAAEALPVLREAFRRWHELGAPYETARVRLLLAGACEALGDRDTGAMEREAAEATVRELRASERPPSPVLPAGLTPREMEVLLLAADGLSNTDIADALVLSVRTVERHLATVYSKLGFEGRAARAAAVSFVHREGLATPRTTMPGRLA